MDMKTDIPRPILRRDTVRRLQEAATDDDRDYYRAMIKILDERAKLQKLIASRELELKDARREVQLMREVVREKAEAQA